MNKFKTGSSYGKLFMTVGLLVLFPIVILPFYPEEIIYAKYFIFPGMLSIVIGLSMVITIKARDYDQWKKQLQFNSLSVLITWLWASIFGAIPFVHSGILPPIRALFESISGWTTTGLSTIDVTSIPHIFLFHRSFMQFCGGLGFILMMLMFINNRDSMGLYYAEGHPDKLHGNLKSTARAIFIIYAVFLVIGTVAYVLLGMPIFDSINNTMCALSTGGFAIKLASIGEYHSFSIEIVTIVLMIIGTTNFATLQLLLRGKIKNFFKVSEVRFMFLLLLIFIPLVGIGLVTSSNLSGIDSARIALFDFTSALSTTGYSTVSYDNFPPFVIGIFIIAMIIGGGAGSTAGGLKMNRAYLLIKIAIMNIKSKLRPTSVVEVSSFNKGYYVDKGKAGNIFNNFIVDVSFTICLVK